MGNECCTYRDDKVSKNPPPNMINLDDISNNSIYKTPKTYKQKNDNLKQNS